MTSTTLEALRRLKLHGMADAYQAVLQSPMQDHPDAHELLARLSLAEEQTRSHRRSELFLKLSKLRYAATLQDIECSSERNLSSQQIQLLSDPGWIKRGENVLISGATGCGKSFLSCALGNHACRQGKRTLYFNMNRLCEHIAVARAEGSVVKWLNRLRKAHLLILDDFGLQPLQHEVKLLLLQILEDRYEAAATIVVSQLPISKWHEYLDEPTVADAILDRLVPKAHRIELKGASRREKLQTLSL